MSDTTEPIYYQGTSFSGVGFMLPGAVGCPAGCTILAPEQVDPEIREQARGWLAERRES